MRTFEYQRAADVVDAVRLLAASPEAKPLAGGTNLVDLMKLGVERPAALVDVSRVDFGGVEETPEGGLLIGAGVANSDLAAHPLVRRRYPALSRALLAGASGQLRNQASTGGNLLQRTRCTSFTDVSKPCNKREPGTGCSALTGVSRELAILGIAKGADPGHVCIATHPGDMAVALTALDAVIRFETVDGSASLPITDFYRLPGEHPERDTDLPAGALITAVELPPLPFAATSTYRKARDRRSYAFALGSVAAALEVTDGTVTDVRLALGAVAHAPWRARIAEDVLRGGPATVEAFTRAAEAELAAATPTEQNAFKVPLLRRLIVGVLSELAGLDEEAAA
ncbi:xanthine dehydrogenase family protein subunit M [Rathayibacter festucae]|uniref:FAD binding domain-containing protein n=1 Tax=Rathayibacter festucae TaxID=110937 RepID=UPI002A6A2321|nr:xanthine dehydrogenase family protein subunit M [Rathayibacter festucae]MDY0912959.1 xanthine dehydrogenase family protein subunit M [Rathayibacter festucae]